jgi:hypothetical protein
MNVGNPALASVWKTFPPCLAGSWPGWRRGKAEWTRLGEAIGAGAS